MIKLKLEELVMVNGIRVAVVKNPHSCDDFSHIIGHTVRIDGTKERVAGVERFAHCPPWRQGEMIGLKLSPKPKPVEQKLF